MTGPVASIGEQMKRGAETAAAAINDAGGVNGRKIKIVIEDDACDPKQAVAVANLIVGQQIKYRRRPRLLGIVDPGVGHLRRKQRADDEPRFVEPGPDRKGPSDDHAPLWARRRAGRVHRPWIANKYKGKKIAILHDKSAYGKGPRLRREGQAQRRPG